MWKLTQNIFCYNFRSPSFLFDGTIWTVTSAIKALLQLSLVLFHTWPRIDRDKWWWVANLSPPPLCVNRTDLRSWSSFDFPTLRQISIFAKESILVYFLGKLRKFQFSPEINSSLFSKFDFFFCHSVCTANKYFIEKRFTNPSSRWEK